MNVFDWLGQVQRVFRYASSWGSLFTSLGIACVLTGITFDFLYGSLYRRINDTSHTYYGPLYWSLLGALCVLLPLSYAAYRVYTWFILLRPFAPDTLGIAITQFEVWSGSSGQLSGSDRRNVIGEVIPSLFQAVRSRLSEDPQWSDSFSLKVLPPTLHIRNGLEAENLLKRQRATLVVWGWLVLRSDSKLQVELFFVGQDLAIKSPSQDMENISFLDINSRMVHVNSLVAAAFAARQRKDYTKVIRFMDMALPLAANLDKEAVDARKGLMQAVMPTVRKSARLAVASPGPHSADLPTSLTSLGGTLSQLGLLADALTIEQHAVAICRELAAASPEQCRPGLAASLASLGMRLSELGRPADALPVAGEAVGLYRELAAASPERYRPDLAASVASLGMRLSELGRPADALPVAGEAVGLYRELAAASPEQYRPGLAASLASLGMRLSELGRPADALPVIKEAVSIHRELDAAIANINPYGPDLAASLTGLARTLSALTRLADALTAQQDAIALRQELAADNPDRYLPDLAASLADLANTLDLLGRQADAVLPTQQAIARYRDLAGASPDRYRPELAGSLAALGARLTELGCPADALSAAHEAVGIYRELADEDSEKYRLGLGLGLSYLGGTLGQLGRLVGALPVTEEAVGTLRELAAARPDLRPDLALSVFNLGGLLELLGRPADALPSAEEAVGLYRELAAGSPEEYRSGLAMALGNLADCLAALGRPAEADAVRGEIAELDSSLITKSQVPSGLSPHLSRKPFERATVRQEPGRMRLVSGPHRGSDRCRADTSRCR